jgi:hypothetical protein
MQYEGDKLMHGAVEDETRIENGSESKENEGEPNGYY